MSSVLHRVEDSRVEKPRSRKRRRELQALRIEQRGCEMPIPCSTCRRGKRRCVLDKESADCSECVRHGVKGCDIGISDAQLERLDRARKNLQSKLDEAESEALEAYERGLSAQLKVRRLKRQMATMDSRAKEMYRREMEIIERLEELEREKDEEEVLAAGESLAEPSEEQVREFDDFVRSWGEEQCEPSRMIV